MNNSHLWTDLIPLMPKNIEVKIKIKYFIIFITIGNRDRILYFICVCVNKHFLSFSYSMHDELSIKQIDIYVQYILNNIQLCYSFGDTSKRTKF